MLMNVNAVAVRKSVAIRKKNLFEKKKKRNERTDEDWEHINNVSVQKNAK